MQAVIERYSSPTRFIVTVGAALLLGATRSPADTSSGHQSPCTPLIRAPTPLSWSPLRGTGRLIRRCSAARPSRNQSMV